MQNETKFSDICKKGEDITLENVSKLVDCYRKNGQIVEPIHIEGIPDGFAYLLRQDVMIDHLKKVGYLIGFTDGAKWGDWGEAFHKPIIVAPANDLPDGKGGSDGDEQTEIMRTIPAFVELYKDNKKRLCQKK